MQPINYDKKIEVAIVLCEQPLLVAQSTLNKRRLGFATLGLVHT